MHGFVESAQSFISQRLRSTVNVQYQDDLQPQQLQSQLTFALRRLLWIQCDCTRPR